MTPQPDLYGPFWTLTTTVFSLFVFSSLAASIVAYLGGKPVEYDFAKLSVAVGLIYSYGLAFPILLWLALRYLGVTEWSVVEVGGYLTAYSISHCSVGSLGVGIWVICLDSHFVALHNTRSSGPLGSRWDRFRVVRLLSRRQCLSCSGKGTLSLIRSCCYELLAQAEAKSTRLLVVIIAVLHAALALVLKILFFSYYVVPSTTPDPLGGTTPELPADNSTSSRFL